MGESTEGKVWTRAVRLPRPALVLLRQLASHANAHVHMERAFPLAPFYRVTFAREQSWRWEPVREHDLATLAIQHAVSCTVDTREERDGGWVDVRVWHITAEGRRLVEEGGVIEAPEEVPTLFPLPTKRRRSVMDHS